MAALHHVGLHPFDPRWALLAQALRPGDVAVLLGSGAANDPRAFLGSIAGLGVEGVRWCVPAPGTAAGGGIECIDDAHWWALVEAHEVLLEWH